MAALAATTMIAGASLAAAPAASAASPRTTVDAWYADFLGRDARADAGSQCWVDRLAVQALGDVLWTITHSNEYNAQRLDELYFSTLGRAAPSDPGAGYWVRGDNDRYPSTGETAYWSPQEVESDINVQALIAATSEYADSPTDIPRSIPAPTGVDRGGDGPIAASHEATCEGAPTSTEACARVTSRHHSVSCAGAMVEDTCGRTPHRDGSRST